MNDDAGVRHPIRIGISSCLLGQAVRFDGGHKRDSFLTETFGAFVEWVPVCPEVECGFGTPRESMRLVRVENGVRLLTVRTAVDLTDRMAAYARRRVAALDAEELCGYVLKKDSPSCGMERVKIYGTRRRSGQIRPRTLRGAVSSNGFRRFRSKRKGGLSDPRLRENFVERVFAYWRLRRLFSGRWNLGALVRLSYRAQVDSDGAFARGLPAAGASRGTGAGGPRADLERRYTEMFMSALAVIATPRRHTNVLQHMAGYFKEHLDADSKQELAAAIEDYRRGPTPQ